MMDPTEDLSARVLLKHILNTEPPRSPVTRSGSQAPGTSGLRRSSRLSRKTAEPQTPQDMLRRSQKHKIRENITRKSLSATLKRRPSTVVLRKLPSSVSMLVSNEDTPRCLLRNILQTEPVKSPAVHEKAQPEEPVQQSADGTDVKLHSSAELSGFDLPDLTIGNVASMAKGLRRKRSRRSFNVTAFEKRLKSGNDAGEEPENSSDDLSSFSLSSSSSLSLKTPLADVRTEKRGLQRKVSNRRKITEEAFEAAVSGQHTGDVSSKGNPSEITDTEGFTLGLSELCMPDVTLDVVNCNTALYNQPGAMTSVSILAARDKPRVASSQLQTDLTEAEQEEERSRGERDKSVKVVPREGVTESQHEERVSESEEEAAEAEGQNQVDDDDSAESETNADTQTEEEAADSHLDENENVDDLTEEEEDSPDSQTEEEPAADSQPEEEQVAEIEDPAEEEETVNSQTEEAAAVALSQDEAEAGSEEEEDSSDSQTEEEPAADSQPEEEQVAEIEDPAEVSQSKDAEEEEEAVGSQTEEAATVALSQDEAEAGSEEEDSSESQTEEEGAAVSPSQNDAEAASQSEEEAEDVAEFQTDDEEEEAEQLTGDLELISRKARRSEGALVLPGVEARNDLDEGIAAGLPDAKSKLHSTFDLNTTLGIGETSQPQTKKPDLAELSIRDQEAISCLEDEPQAEAGGSFHLHRLSLDAEASMRGSVLSPGDAQNSAEQEEEWEDDDETEAVQSKTPAFVKKRNFFHSDPPASPSVLKNVQASSTSEALPAAKPKQVRRRKTGTTRKQAVLPKTYLMSVFRHFAKTKVSADVYPVLNEIMDKFLDRLAEDLETYAAHAKRKTIEVEDAIILLKRQGYVNDKVPVEVLIEKYLRMEQRKLLIPIATSGNVVIPKKGGKRF